VTLLTKVATKKDNSLPAVEDIHGTKCKQLEMTLQAAGNDTTSRVVGKCRYVSYVDMDTVKAF